MEARQVLSKLARRFNIVAGLIDSITGLFFSIRADAHLETDVDQRGSD